MKKYLTIYLNRIPFQRYTTDDQGYRIGIKQDISSGFQKKRLYWALYATPTWWKSTKVPARRARPIM